MERTKIPRYLFYFYNFYTYDIKLIEMLCSFWYLYFQKLKNSHAVIVNEREKWFPISLRSVNWLLLLLANNLLLKPTAMLNYLSCKSTKETHFIVKTSLVVNRSSRIEPLDVYLHKTIVLLRLIAFSKALLIIDIKEVFLWPKGFNKRSIIIGLYLAMKSVNQRI